MSGRVLSLLYEWFVAPVRKFCCDKRNSSAMQSRMFDDMGRRLRHERLFESASLMYTHPKTKASVFIGNIDAASSLSFLESKSIRVIVNCTDTIQDFHKDNPKFTYHKFDICAWMARTGCSNEEVEKFVDPTMKFIEEMLLEGKNVLVHCLAGAHRAGTTALLMMVYFDKMEPQRALEYCQSQRHIIQPVGQLSQLVLRYYTAKTVTWKKQQMSVASS
uniref:protein-tyrosine-phosphatase n=1 Tax=Chromera velia CCMP2878 TaxID=1169474 RepID=A0A0G4F4G1_9ALVE|mmetsp:Transcript_29244/g.57408  ORF Transcript_29244/g.57408 Transcript_29244/m.57408 type:complete len:218 (+) Transcript_29244:207-860(+)|eukprot:Cvel_2751.t1-p1 / transcript=Cvel_2751.t1 / gene=Cvel_2751 / organism=Chromera_velia_CCMP2878 / gene_product=Dual specificity protein phosphatase 10, putative / transcript_product=Dual specificity protein phosphatase 10, putative / location=Cvel_scaffold110:96327-98673(+) / protein_length=217 / sequence_SO=supercontig / SO=protein_coding / is_pseudo=false